MRNMTSTTTANPVLFLRAQDVRFERKNKQTNKHETNCRTNT